MLITDGQIGDPFPATVPGRGEREGSLVLLITDGQIGGLSPLRPPSRRWESGGARDLCFRCVYSSLGLPGGGGRVVSASRWWNNGAGARLPPRLRPLWRCRHASGVWCPPFCGSGGMCCLGRGRGGEGDDLAVALLSPVSVFAAVRWAPASPWRFWGLVWSCSCWRVTPASLAGRGGEGRSGSVGVLASAWWWWGLFFGCALLWLMRCLLRPSPAGRGGEGGGDGGAVLRAAVGLAVVRVRVRCKGGCSFGWRLCRSGCWDGLRHGGPPDRSGAVPPSMRHDRLHPGCRAGCLLRRIQRGLILLSFFSVLLLDLASLPGMAAAVAQAKATSAYRGVQGPSCYFLVVQGLLCKFVAAGPSLDVSCAFN